MSLLRQTHPHHRSLSDDPAWPAPPLRRRRLVAKLAVLLTAVFAVPFGCLAAWALFSASAPPEANSFTAATVGAGTVPTASVSGRNVTLNWSAAANAAGYTVARANASPGNLPATMSGTCAALVTGTTCVDRGLPLNGTNATTWSYTDTPFFLNWLGATSPASATVTIPAPALSLSTPTFAATGGSATATVANFFDGETVTFCLDATTSCPALQTLGTVIVPASGGTATATITLPSGVTTGSHAIRAIGSQGSAPSTPITVTPGPAAKLAFTAQPGTVVAGATMPFQVAVQDALGNAVTTSTAPIALAITTNPGSGALTCSTNPVNAAGGVASFACSINKTGTGYVLTATSTGLTAATSSTFNVTPGAANKLAITTQPANATAGANIPVQVAVQDVNGNTVTTSGTSVTLGITNNPGSGTLTCTSNPRSTTSGVATFACSINRPGTAYVLTATSTGLTSVASSPFTISVGAAAKLAITTQPTSTTAGTNIPVQVAVQDANGNTVTTSAAPVTLAVTTNPGSSSLTCTSNPVSASSGVASFACSLNRPGVNYTLTATSPGLTSIGSSPFNISVGPAAKLAFTSQPSVVLGSTLATFTVAVQDSSGNTVTTSSAPVSLVIGSGPNQGALTCTNPNGSGPVTTSSGVATFTCRVNRFGAYTLSATSGTLTQATGNQVTVVGLTLSGANADTGTVSCTVSITSLSTNCTIPGTNGSNSVTARLALTGSALSPTTQTAITVSSKDRGIVTPDVGGTLTINPGATTSTGTFTYTKTNSADATLTFTTGSGPATTLTLVVP